MKSKDQIKTETEQLFVAVEQHCKVSITVHEYNGKFMFPDGDPALSLPRQRHQHPLCLLYHPKDCVEDCMREANRISAARKEPWCHLCWKGMYEVIVPLVRDGNFIGTLFAGCFQGEEKATCKNLRFEKRFAPKRAQLPVLTDEVKEHVISIMQVLAKALLNQIVEIKQCQPFVDSRQEKVRVFIDKNIRSSISLSQLADELCLSESRTCHVIQEIFGKPFKQLLLEERMKRAKYLLGHTNCPISDIADFLGFSDIFYFSKVFKKEVKLAPTAFRKQVIDQRPVEPKQG